VDLGIPDLTEDQIEVVCQSAETAARKNIFSKVNQKLVDKLDIIVEAEGAKPVSFTVEVDLVLLPETKGVNEKSLVSEAVKVAFEAIESHLRKLT
jgi:hypothetical protein